VANNGEAMGETGDVGAANGAWHVHYCVTTAPDRPQYGAFESVPVAFRNYSVSDDGGTTWHYRAVGVPLQGEMVRREAAKPGQAQSPEVNTAADVLNHGSVSGEISLTSGATVKAGGHLKTTLTASWGEPISSTSIAVNAGNVSGPWSYSLNGPDYTGYKVEVLYTGPALPDGATVSGESASFAVPANGNATANVKLKKTLPVVIK
jgi:hypothetical protein